MKRRIYGIAQQSNASTHREILHSVQNDIVRTQNDIVRVQNDRVCVQHDNTNNVILSETKDLKACTTVHRHGDLEILHCVQNDKV